MRRLFLIVTVVLLLVLGITGCGPLAPAITEEPARDGGTGGGGRRHKDHTDISG